MKRLMTLVEQIMDIRKYDNNVMKLKVGEIDLSLFIEEIVMLFKPAIRRKNIVIKCDLREHMMAYVDKEKFEKVIVNLLSNALKFTSENGYIRISCEETEFNFIICVEDRCLTVFTKVLILVREAEPESVFHWQDTSLSNIKVRYGLIRNRVKERNFIYSC